MVMKWNPQSGRYENKASGIDGQDSPIPNYPAFHGDVYIDSKTGVVKYRSGGGRADVPLDYNEKTGKYEITIGGKRVAYNTPAGAQAYKGSAPIGANNPRTAGTSKPTAPKAGAPTTTVPKAGATPTTTVPKAATTTTTPKGTTTTTVPKGTPTTTVPPTTPTTTVPPATSQVNPVLDAWLKEQFPDNTPAENSALAAYFNTDGSGGGSGGGVTASQRQERAWQLEDQKREAKRAKSGAAGLAAAGAKAQEQYNLLAKTGFDESQKAAGDFYTKQAEGANTAIDKATSDYLASLIAPTAYSNVPIAQLTPQMQGLQQNLQAYGATGQQAQQQQQQDTGFNQFLAQLMRGSTEQLAAADKNYFEALKNAGTGGQAAAKIGVAQNTAAMQQQSTAQADAIRRQLLQAGIEALISGQTNAANRLAQ